jgi:hypothetical protein
MLAPGYILGRSALRSTPAIGVRPGAFGERRRQIVVDVVAERAEQTGSEDRHENSVGDTKIRHENSIGDTKNTEIRHENSTVARRRGRPKSLQPLTNAERCKRYRDRQRVRISVSAPVYVEKNLYEKKKLALQVETVSGARANLSVARPMAAPGWQMTVKQKIKFDWLQARLRQAGNELPPQQWAELIEALPDALVVEWACGRANLPPFARHHLEALDDRRRKEAALGDPVRASPITDSREDAA